MTAQGQGVRAWLGFVHGVYSERIDEAALKGLYEGATSLNYEGVRLVLIATDRAFVRAHKSEFPYDPVLDSVTLGEHVHGPTHGGRTWRDSPKMEIPASYASFWRIPNSRSL